MLISGFQKTQLPILVKETDGDQNPESPQIRWNFVQKLVKSYWDRWIKEYLLNLQIRSRNQRELQNLEIGDLVFITEEKTPPLLWPIGRIADVYDGNDKLVRVAKIKLPFGKIIIRPIIKLRKLPFIGDPADSEQPSPSSNSPDDSSHLLGRHTSCGPLVDPGRNEEADSEGAHGLELE